MIKLEYIKSLIYLTGKTITSVALEAGVDPTNLSRALKGHSTVSVEKMEKVLDHLGVDSVTGTLKPVVHHWRVNLNSATFNLIQFDQLISDLVPGKGEIINLGLEDDPRWTAIIGNDGARIIMENSNIVLEEFLREWKLSFRRITATVIKKLIEDETLTPSEFDEILRLNYGTHFSDGGSFAREDEAENVWTWDLIMKRAKESGLTPREVAEKLGIEGHHE